MRSAILSKCCIDLLVFLRHRTDICFRYGVASRSSMAGFSSLSISVDAARIGQRNRMLVAVANSSGETCWAPPQVCCICLCVLFPCCCGLLRIGSCFGIYSYPDSVQNRRLQLPGVAQIDSAVVGTLQPRFLNPCCHTAGDRSANLRRTAPKLYGGPGCGAVSGIAESIV